ncbi:hypothetical protein NP493_8g08002 [Ridgeia piscesae]|uniref:TROVE domain-containing protein n=1 Tax=Ridgeia piscesae TaxID=27915 RepID=A0AAD9ULA6_RIDPI|nr:hypothetical protein NP493_8g08002 [Ridgeia piscesae]
MATQSQQVRIHNDGYAFNVDDLSRLTRFLCLGSEGGTYYVSEQQLLRQNVQCITRLIAAGRGNEVIQTIVDFSVSGRTAKQNGLMFAMAMCARQSVDPDTKRLCYENLHLVCRIPTHLFTFIGYCEALSDEGTGWGRAHRRAIVKWYMRFGETPRSAKHLAMLVTKYKNRNGWSHLDVLRLAHPKPDKDNGLDGIFKYIVKGFDEATKLLQESNVNLLAYLQAVEDLKAQKDPQNVNVTGLAEIIRQHRLVREHVNTELLQFPEIWEALLEEMPMTAMTRNLGKMSAIGMLAAGSKYEKMIVRRLKNREFLKKARIHPFNVLVALTTYKNGKGDLGSLRWEPNAAIMEALDDAFYYTFKFVEPTNKRYLLALDVSGSMFWGGVNGSRYLQPGTAAAALSLITAETEQHCDFVGFSHQLVDLPIRKGLTLPQVEYVIQHMPMGGTDCSLPMAYAREHNKQYDVFVVYTDCETGVHGVPPATALRQYQQHSGISDAKLIVVAMTSNEFTIADPNDPNMMDMAGFDSNGPQVMKDFVSGSIMEGRAVHPSGARPVHVDEEDEMEIGFGQQETGDADDVSGGSIQPEGASYDGNLEESASFSSIIKPPGEEEEQME